MRHAIVATFLALSVGATATHAADLVVVSHPDLAEAWESFATWKTSHGITATVIDTAHIDATYGDEQVDLAEAIRRCVRDHVDNHGTRWVILGGDADGPAPVPDRDSLHPRFEYSDIPSDAFFVSANAWDENGNGVLAEDAADVGWDYGDGVTGIGRLPLRTADHIAAYTAKVIAYESAYPDDRYAGGMIQTCVVSSAYAKLATSRRTIAGAWSHSAPQLKFHETSQWNPLHTAAPLMPTDLGNLFSSPTISKLHIHGHGLRDCWVMDQHQPFDLHHVAELNHATTPVVTTVSCFTGHFDAPADPAISEALLRHAHGGAIAIIAPAREGVPVFANRADMREMVLAGKMDGTTEMLTHFWEEGLSDDLSIGEAFARSKARILTNLSDFPGRHWILCEMNLLGDPSLPIRSQPPLPVNWELPTQIAANSPFAIGTGVPGARVTLTHNDQVIASTTADAHGSASFSLADLPPLADITVTAAGPCNVTVITLQ